MVIYVQILPIDNKSTLRRRGAIFHNSGIYGAKYSSGLKGGREAYRERALMRLKRLIEAGRHTAT